MKIKSKLILGVGFLFVLIGLLTVLSIVYINKLSKDSKNILTDNYNTIEYSRLMLLALNKGLNDSTSVRLFSDNLDKQKNTITEVGEGELTQKLAADFKAALLNANDTVLQKTIHQDLSDIMLLNMQAIKRKSSIAQSTADNSIFWVSVTGTICLLLAFTMLINFPGNIANPIRNLTASIKEIAAENYSERIHFDQQNEFGELSAAFNTMAQKLQEYKAGNIEKLTIEKTRIETLINNMSEPVIGLDEKQRILFMNDIALKVAGLSLEEVIGKQVNNIAKQNDLIKDLIKDIPANNTLTEKLRLAPVKIYANNKESYFEKEIIPINIIPTGEASEKQIGNVILLQNVTPYKELDFAKTNFIATISHELKTPISSIKMSLQLLETAQVGNLNAEQQNLVSGIKDDANRLLKITGELLNMTQVESGLLHLNKTTVTVDQVFNYAISATRAAAEEKNIKLHIDASPSLPSFEADKEKISWVLTNFLSNAIRYSYDNSVITLSCKSGNGKLIFSVKDSGQGIAQQYLGKVFERYFRIPGSRKEGTGLGLSISKEFIEAHGGQIIVESELGAGSIFSFWLSVKTN
ncbi:MAG: ATP-binding protein [Ferruginibacter sp.]